MSNGFDRSGMSCVRWIAWYAGLMVEVDDNVSLLFRSVADVAAELTRLSVQTFLYARQSKSIFACPYSPTVTKKASRRQDVAEASPPSGNTQ